MRRYREVHPNPARSETPSAHESTLRGIGEISVLPRIWEVGQTGSTCEISESLGRRAHLGMGSWVGGSTCVVHCDRDESLQGLSWSRRIGTWGRSCINLK
jgi:hypothetical protein